MQQPDSAQMDAAHLKVCLVRHDLTQLLGRQVGLIHQCDILHSQRFLQSLKQWVIIDLAPVNCSATSLSTASEVNIRDHIVLGVVVRAHTSRYRVC